MRVAVYIYTIIKYSNSAQTRAEQRAEPSHKPGIDKNKKRNFKLYVESLTQVIPVPPIPQ